MLVFIGSSGLIDTVSTVTDNAGNTYVKAYGVATGTGGNTELWYSLNSIPANSVTVTFSGTTTTKSVFVREYRSIPQATTFDRIKTNSGSGTSVTTNPTTSPTDVPLLVVCSCSCLGTNPTNSVGSGYDNYASQLLLAGLSLHSIQDKTVSVIGAQTGTMTAGGTLPVWDVGLATFIMPAALKLNNYGFVKVGDGMSTGERIR